MFNYNSLPANDNINSYSFSVDLQGQFFMQKGKMIAYYGQISFESLFSQNIINIVRNRFSSPLYQNHWVVASGQGKLILADRKYHINSFDLEDGNLTVRADNLLGFESSLSLKESIVPGFLTLLGTGKFLASSSSPVHFVEPPVRVDPEALVGWADCPSPSHHYDYAYTQSLAGAVQSFVGIPSGEEHQFDFTGKGTVLMQSSEEISSNALLQNMENQLPFLNNPSLRSLHNNIAQRLQPNQQ